MSEMSDDRDYAALIERLNKLMADLKRGIENAETVELALKDANNALTALLQERNTARQKVWEEAAKIAESYYLVDQPGLYTKGNNTAVGNIARALRSRQSSTGEDRE